MSLIRKKFLSYVATEVPVRVYNVCNCTRIWRHILAAISNYNRNCNVAGKISNIFILGRRNYFESRYKFRVLFLLAKVPGCLATG